MSQLWLTQSDVFWYRIYGVPHVASASNSTLDTKYSILFIQIEK